MILETVTLAFDPKTIEIQEIKDVFANDLARTIWLAVKSGHMTSQYFNNDCLHYAKVIENAKKKGPLTANMLFRILSGVAAPPGHGIIGGGELNFATDLLPFVDGQKTISFTVDIKKRTEEKTFQERISGLGLGKPE